MKQLKFSRMNYLAVLLLFLTTGCERWSPKGEYKVFGTATVNGKEYVDMRHRGWNSEFTEVSIDFYPHYKMFQMGFVFLQPKNLGKTLNYEYKIQFCLTTENQEIQTNLPYKIEYNESLEYDNYFSNKTLTTIVFNKSKIISSDVNNGIAILEDLKTNKIHSMSGYLIIHLLDLKNHICKGEYLLKKPVVSGKEEFIINGKFEAYLFESSWIFLNNKI